MEIEQVERLLGRLKKIESRLDAMETQIETNHQELLHEIRRRRPNEEENRRQVVVTDCSWGWQRDDVPLAAHQETIDTMIIIPKYSGSFSKT